MELRGGGGAAVGSGDLRAARIMDSFSSSPSLSQAGLCSGFVSESQNHEPKGKLKEPRPTPTF